MADVMSMEDIEARFDGEWVLIGDPEVTPMEEVLGGQVLFHSRSRDELYRRALELKPRRAAVLYIGEPAEDIAYIL